MVDIYNTLFSKAPLRFQLISAVGAAVYIYLAPDKTAPAIFFTVLKAFFGMALAISVAGVYFRIKNHAEKKAASEASANALVRMAEIKNGKK